ncbi:hypothetical protein D3C80_1910300 [compost metagenome]
MLDDGLQGGGVEQVGGVDDVGFVFAARVAGGQRALQLALGYRIDFHALLAHQAQDVQVGAGLLREADGVEALQAGDLCADDFGVVDPQRGAEALDEFFCAGEGKAFHE